MKKNKCSKWKDINKNKKSINRGIKANKRRKSYLKWKNVRELNKNINERHELRQRQWQRFRHSNPVTIVPVPENFSLIKYPEEALEFIAKLKALSLGRKNVFVSMINVKYISHDAIALLLSVLAIFKGRRIRVYGDNPKNKNCNQILERSGFFNYVIGVISEENKSTRNSILTRQEFNVMPEKTAPIVRESMKTVGGKAAKNQAVQGMLIELMANTHNHAAPNNKRTKWWLSVDHDKENKKVSFVFLDNGQGILETISIKFLKEFGHLFSGDQVSLLKECFSGDIGSRTKFANRGLGLPKIKNRFEENFVSNMIVITNNVFLHFETNKGINLNNYFEGTLYYWELDLDCQPWISS